jgi:hypothetical protein
MLHRSFCRVRHAHGPLLDEFIELIAQVKFSEYCKEIGSKWWSWTTWPQRRPGKVDRRSNRRPGTGAWMFTGQDKTMCQCPWVALYRVRRHQNVCSHADAIQPFDPSSCNVRCQKVLQE